MQGATWAAGAEVPHLGDGLQVGQFGLVLRGVEISDAALCTRAVVQLAPARRRHAMTFIIATLYCVDQRGRVGTILQPHYQAGAGTGKRGRVAGWTHRAVTSIAQDLACVRCRKLAQGRKSATPLVSTHPSQRTRASSCRTRGTPPSRGRSTLATSASRSACSEKTGNSHRCQGSSLAAAMLSALPGTVTRLQATMVARRTDAST